MQIISSTLNKYSYELHEQIVDIGPAVPSVPCVSVLAALEQFASEPTLFHGPRGTKTQTGQE